MKTKEQIETMYNFIGRFNDGQFMNQDYRKGIMDALSFVLYDGERLENIAKSLNIFKQGVDKK